MIAVLLDQGLAPGAATILRASGFDAIHVSEIGMDQATDAEILDTARNQDRVCITLDHDFHTHLALAGHGRPSVVLLRIERVGAEEQATLIESICRQFQDALLRGAAVSADTRTVRIRRLPLR
jgi:predicted nuclease of predicted toxin-antitoxin system